METRSFAVNFDYSSPFARNASEHVITALNSGHPLDVSFKAFSLKLARDPQATADSAPELRALAAGVVVRENNPGLFLLAHRALFSCVQAGSVGQVTLAAALESAQVEPDSVARDMSDGWPYEIIRREQSEQTAEYGVFGTPTFFVEGDAAFVRIMTRPHGDAELAARTVTQVLDLIASSAYINELKHTSPYARLAELRQRHLISDQDFEAQLSQLRTAVAISSSDAWKKIGIRV